jgi:excisionase family DNA binding protein
MDTKTTAQPDPSNHVDEVLTTSEAARFLKISLRTLQSMVRQGQLHPRRFGTKGRVWRFVRSELLAPPKTDGSVSATIPLSSRPPSPAPTRTLQRINGALRYR